MKKYPQVGEQVRVKGETGLHTIIQTWGFVDHPLLLDDNRTFRLRDVVTRHQKTVLVYVIQQHYGGRCGWEDVTEEELLSEARDRRREYRENTNYPTRLIRRYEPNQLYQP